jgi:predicted dinucleotide-binding enzyme
MRVAVIGAGNVGKALGEAPRRKGHDVVYGVRDATRSDAKPTETVEKAIGGPMPLSSPPHTTPPVRCSASMQRCLPEKW